MVWRKQRIDLGEVHLVGAGVKKGLEEMWCDLVDIKLWPPERRDLSGGVVLVPVPVLRLGDVKCSTWRFDDRINQQAARHVMELAMLSGYLSSVPRAALIVDKGGTSNYKTTHRPATTFSWVSS